MCKTCIKCGSKTARTRAKSKTGLCWRCNARLQGKIFYGNKYVNKRGKKWK